MKCIPQTPLPIDPLAETLHLIRLNGTLYCRGELTAPWGVHIPQLDDVMTFQIVTSGRGSLEIEGEEPLLIEAGSLTLLPHGSAHVVRSDPSAQVEPLFEIPVERMSERYEIMRYGGGGALTQCTYGVVLVEDPLTRRLLQNLPKVLKVDAWDDDTSGWLQSTIGFIAREAKELKPGGETVITRLADVIVIQAIRTWLDRAEEARAGWLGALRDPQLGRAIALMHRFPEQDWTLAALAERVGMSRSAFAGRFSESVGETPMKYLTQFRLQTAKERLLGSEDSVAEIGFSLGYQSESAFGRAFKNHFEMTPLSLRRSRSRRANSAGTPFRTGVERPEGLARSS